jgi:hypothetical protein
VVVQGHMRWYEPTERAFLARSRITRRYEGGPLLGRQVYKNDAQSLDYSSGGDGERPECGARGPR